MAEHVQAAMDQMVAPLRDLMDRHIFSEEEIRAIVTRRRESEYLLRRRAARKADFVRYIEAEMMLEKLRALRTTKKKRDHRRAQREKGIETEQTDSKDPIGDVHVVQHIHLLFVRAIRKFRSDLSLHLQHAEFCKSVKSWTRLGRVYAEALQIFPREAGIWIEAASNEFFGPNRSVKSARVLLQRGLRLNGSSQELWIQYFTLELHYAQTLKGRRTILRPSENESDGENDTNYNKIPMVILKNAIKSIPDNVQFRLKFLDALEQFPDTVDLMEYVQASMAQDFADEPESWIARAMYQAQRQRDIAEPESKKARTSETTDDGDPVLLVLKDAIETLPTSEMLLQAFRFAEDYRSELEESNDNSNVISQVDQFIQDIWAEEATGNSSDLAMEQTRYLLRQQNGKQALQTIKKHCTTQRNVPSEAWLLWASLANTSLKKQTSILKLALENIPVDQHPDYVAMLLQYLAAQLKAASQSVDNDDDYDNSSEIFETLQNLILLAPKTAGDVVVQDTGLDFELQGVFEGYKACLDHFYQSKGIDGARKIYEAVLFRSSCRITADTGQALKSFCDRCLALEQTAKNRKILRRLYDKIIDIFEGTALEESYRHDRNENAVYA